MKHELKDESDTASELNRVLEIPVDINVERLLCLSQSTLGNSNILISWLSTIIGFALLLLPISLMLAWSFSRFPKRVFFLTGLSGGLMFLPISVWMYLQFGTDCARMVILGIPGILLLALALMPLYAIELLPTMDFVPSIFATMLFWSVSFSLLGAIFDYFSSRLGIDVTKPRSDNGKMRSLRGDDDATSTF